MKQVEYKSRMVREASRRRLQFNRSLNERKESSMRKCEAGAFQARETTEAQA